MMNVNFFVNSYLFYFWFRNSVGTHACTDPFRNASCSDFFGNLFIIVKNPAKRFILPSGFTPRHLLIRNQEQPPKNKSILAESLSFHLWTTNNCLSLSRSLASMIEESEDKGSFQKRSGSWRIQENFLNGMENQV